MTLWAFNRPFKILGCDHFTAEYYLEKYERIFPIGEHDNTIDNDKSIKLKNILIKFI